MKHSRPPSRPRWPKCRGWSAKRRTDAMPHVQAHQLNAHFKTSVMAGLDPAIHRASVRERQSLAGAWTRAGWMAATGAAMAVGGEGQTSSSSFFVHEFDQV